MKKLFIALLAAFALTSASAQEAFPDIPAGHWAGEAVSRIADLGIVIGFPDGTFRGNESFTRYQAALVVSRLLDVIQSNLDAMQAMTDEDIASLRNALQELASDVAAQGVRLNAVEGQVAQLSDDVAATAARLDDMLMGMDDAMFDELRNQIESLRVLADTAAAQAAAAEELARAADARSRQNANAIANLEDLVGLLGRDVDALRAGVAPGELPEGLLDQVNRNTNDIANIREFVILLRRDQVALRDRVAALEASDAEQAAQIADLDARLTRVEQDLLVLSGSIGLTYRVTRLSGDNLPFDVDRVFGLNNRRNMGASTFSTGTSDDGADVGERAQDRQDIGPAQEGGVNVALNLSIGFNQERTGTGVGGLNTFGTAITLDMRRATNLTADDGSTFAGYVFRVREVTTTFSGIGGAPLSFQFGENPQATFTPYVFRANGAGFVATIGAPDFLAFLNPTLTAAYGEVDVTKSYSTAVTADPALACPSTPTITRVPGATLPAACPQTNDASLDIWPDTYYRGIRATLSPLQGETFSLTLGGSFAQVATNAGENADAAGDNEEITVFGVDGQIGISFLDINFEYAQSSGTMTSAGQGLLDRFGNPIAETRGSNSSILYVQATADVSGVPVLESFSANYRSMPAAWEGIFAGTSGRPFSLDQVGFGINAGLSLFIVDVTAYFDNYSVAAGDNVTAYGVEVGAELFRAFSLTGFFRSASVNGTQVDNLSSRRPVGAGATPVGASTASLARNGNNYSTGFGVGLRHDGASANALIPNLNLTFEYAQINAGLDTSRITAEADYTLAISILNLTPYVSYVITNNPDADQASSTVLRAGTGLETQPLDIFLQPSLMAAVNFRNADYTGPATYTATEFQWSVGLMLNEFLFDNSVLTAKYGSWTGTNMNTVTNTQGDNDFATDISGGDVNNGVTQSATGYEVIWTYYELQFAYGAYTVTTGAEATAGQSFRIRYTVNF
jgi:hypothetical protein